MDALYPFDLALNPKVADVTLDELPHTHTAVGRQ
jgi:hypothetical protein